MADDEIPDLFGGGSTPAPKKQARPARSAAKQPRAEQPQAAQPRAAKAAQPRAAQPQAAQPVQSSPAVAQPRTVQAPALEPTQAKATLVAGSGAGSDLLAFDPLAGGGPGSGVDLDDLTEGVDEPAAPVVAEQPATADFAPPSFDLQPEIATDDEELEFDPMSVRRPGDEFRVGGDAFPASSAPSPAQELDLDALQPPAESAAADVSSVPGAAEVPLPPPDAPVSRGPAIPVPDAPEVSPPPESLPVASQRALAALELGEGAVQPRDVPPPVISEPPSPEVGAQIPSIGPQHPSLSPASVPSSQGTQAKSSSPPDASAAPPPASPDLGSFGNFAMDAGPAGWDLDGDLSGAPAAPLTVEAPVQKEDDGPFPKGITPYPEDLEVNPEEVARQSGFGDRPSNFLGAPMYFIRCAVGLRELEARLGKSESHLKQLELSRDRVLGDLCESLRPQLEDKDRFRSLYTEADKYLTLIAEREKVVAAADQQSAQVLSELELELQRLRADRDLKHKAAAEQLQVVEMGRLNIKRAKAAIRRTDIELRNVVTRARQLVPEGANMPPELGARYLVLQDEKKAADEALTGAVGPQKNLEQLYNRMDDDHRRAFADLQATEDRKAGLMMAHEGDMAAHVGALEEARSGRIKELADGGRALLELRNEVPVERPVRVSLHAADQAVAEAALVLETLKQSRRSLDQTSFDVGKAIVLGLAAAVVLMLLYAAIF